MVREFHFSLLILLFAVFKTTFLFSQEFNRIDESIGLSIAEENSGVSVADYNGDNLLDLFVVAKSIDIDGVERTHSRLFRNNNNGTFTDVTLESGLIDLLTDDYSQNIYYIFDGAKVGASWGDYDNDGYPDLFFTNTFNVLLYHNNGDGTFENVTNSAGLEVPTTCQFAGATWFDYNNDSFLDIYISDWGGCTSNRLFKNNADGTFSNVTALTNIAETVTRKSFTALPYDFNSDGFIDLYVTNDLGQPNYLYINQDGISFSEQAADYGLDNSIDDMGIAFGDFNMDGLFDIYISGKFEGSLLKNSIEGFEDVAGLYNVFDSGWAWGATFADFDLDGDEDLFVGNGYSASVVGNEENFYYRNNYFESGSGFENLITEVGLSGQTATLSNVDFDYDNDGDLDLFLSHSSGPSRFYENKILSFNDEVPSHNWFQLSLQGTLSNRDAIGTEVILQTPTKNLIRHKNGVGFIAQSLKPLHFGLDQDEDVLEITIKWPSGLIETYQNLSINSFYEAVEGQGITNLNIEPSIKIYGCTDPMSCNYNPDATLDNGLCSYLESEFIAGPSSVGFLSEATYSYNLSENSTANWQVEGGHILNGQGTSQITVEWGLNETGTLNVVEYGEDCNGLPVSLEVNINLIGTPDDISIARLWNEALLASIRKDYARPTVHARNLFHTSVVMYDIWAIYDEIANPYFVGNEVHGFSSDLLDFNSNEDQETSVHKAISYAMYRLLTRRFQNSPNLQVTQSRFDFLMEQLGYDINYTSLDYQSGDPAALGNYVASIMIAYGLVDGSRESTGYDNAYYEPINPALAPEFENSTLIYPNRWQPLSLQTYIDQSGNLIEGNEIPFLSPEWGKVNSFALTDEDLTINTREGNTFYVFKDPSDPPYLNIDGSGDSSDSYKWAFSLVSVWGSHLDPSDGVIWDVSPNSIGGISEDDLPTSYLQHPSFYNLYDGGDPSVGHSVNPVTGSPYEPQWVPRGDYTRVLAEFWADGPESETPPGHWFTILNYVSDHAMFEKRFNGTGDVLSDLEWDVKSYFILGGAMHDAAISAWSVKGWYDYLRPISAIRYMASMGQSTDPSLDNYNPHGIPLIPGYIEVIEEEDELAGAANQNVGKIKLFSWKGHANVYNPETDMAGVGWILSENWWPYQRPSFVTPPFAGYVSGHSTFSRAAAEVMTLITGDEYFPGGMGEFHARQNEFLVFEEGPSMDVTLQWATYRDASDQCSLSRIWGGIHPPSDDMPGRLMGVEIGNEAYDFGVPYFYGTLGTEEHLLASSIFPNPVQSGKNITLSNYELQSDLVLYDVSGRAIRLNHIYYDGLQNATVITIPETTSSGIYVLSDGTFSYKVLVTD